MTKCCILHPHELFFYLRLIDIEIPGGVRSPNLYIDASQTLGVGGYLFWRLAYRLFSKLDHQTLNVHVVHGHMR